MRFVPNPQAPALLAATPQMVASLREKAEAAAEVAREIAPRETGAYAERIGVDAGIDGGRALARINAFDYKSLWIEMGTYKWAAHATLRRACDAAGLRLRAGRRR